MWCLSNNVWDWSNIVGGRGCCINAGWPSFLLLCWCKDCITMDDFGTSTSTAAHLVRHMQMDRSLWKAWVFKLLLIQSCMKYEMPWSELAKCFLVLATLRKWINFWLSSEQSASLGDGREPGWELDSFVGSIICSGQCPLPAISHLWSRPAASVRLLQALHRLDAHSNWGVAQEPRFSLRTLSLICSSSARPGLLHCPCSKWNIRQRPTEVVMSMNHPFIFHFFY